MRVLNEMSTSDPVFDSATPVIVLKFDPNVMHHGGMGAIRSLGRLGVPVYGVHENRWAPAANSRFLQGRFFWQPSPEDVAGVKAGLLQLAQRIGRPAMLLTTDDAGAIFLAEHGEDLREWFVFPRPPAQLPRQLAGKFEMFQLCRDLGVPCPDTVVPQSPGEAYRFATAKGYPVIAKLTTPWHHGGAKLRSTVIISSRDELDVFLADCHGHDVGYMLQEFIPGGPGQDWFVHGYADSSATCRPIFTGVKERSYPAHAGLTSLGRATSNRRLADEMSRMVRAISYRGIFDLDLRFDPRDGQYKLLDFNPRLGAQFRLFQDSAGIDVVRAQYLDLTGAAIPTGEQVSGRRFIVENYDPLCSLAYWRRGELDLKVWLASLRSIDETAWFARDDLRPFGLMCMYMGMRLATRPLSRNTPRRRPTLKSDGVGASTGAKPRFKASPSARSAGAQHVDKTIRREKARV